MVRLLVGEFRGTDFPNESVLTMSCDKESTTLVTADTQGFIYTWDIYDYCIKPQAEVSYMASPVSCNLELQYNLHKQNHSAGRQRSIVERK